MASPGLRAVTCRERAISVSSKQRLFKGQSAYSLTEGLCVFDKAYPGPLISEVTKDDTSAPTLKGVSREEWGFEAGSAQGFPQGGASPNISDCALGSKQHKTSQGGGKTGQIFGSHSTVD